MAYKCGPLAFYGNVEVKMGIEMPYPLEVSGIGAGNP